MHVRDVVQPVLVVVVGVEREERHQRYAGHNIREQARGRLRAPSTRGSTAARGAGAALLGVLGAAVAFVVAARAVHGHGGVLGRLFASPKARGPNQPAARLDSPVARGAAERDVRVQTKRFGTLLEDRRAEARVAR
eukprot:scaffold75049_cov78-Phaeocystis_antarctica.AAC.1